MKQLKMHFIKISNNLNEIRASLGLDKGYSKGGTRKCANQKQYNKNLKNDNTVYHLDWQVVPYVPTQFPSLHRDVITLEEFAEGMAEIEEEQKKKAQKEKAKKQQQSREVISDSESEDTEDGSDAETRSEDESSDSEMDDFVVNDDYPDTDKEEEKHEDEDTKNADVKLSKTEARKKAAKRELMNLGLSSGEVGESFAVAKEGLGKRKRRQTDHLAVRIFQAGEIEREIDCYDAYDHQKKEIKEEAYHKAHSTRTLWKKPKDSALAITGPHADWAKNAINKKQKKEGSQFAHKKTKPGQRPCASTARAAEERKKRKSDIRAWLLG